MFKGSVRGRQKYNVNLMDRNLENQMNKQRKQNNFEFGASPRNYINFEGSV